jgi:hypothetical protein
MKQEKISLASEQCLHKFPSVYASSVWKRQNINSQVRHFGLLIVKQFFIEAVCTACVSRTFYRSVIDLKLTSKYSTRTITIFLHKKNDLYNFSHLLRRSIFLTGHCTILAHGRHVCVLMHGIMTNEEWSYETRSVVSTLTFFLCRVFKTATSRTANTVCVCVFFRTCLRAVRW